MADSRGTFIKRVFSALLGAAVVFAVGFFGGTRGLELVCTVAIALANREFARMAFPHWRMPSIIAWFYWLIAAALYTFFFMREDFTLLAFALGNVLFLTGALWLARGRVDNEGLLPGLTSGCFGLLYCVLLPHYALKVARLDEGAQWFFILLSVVFFGDTFAYFGGRWLGRRKLMPEVSPNKTWAGALAGLGGSALAGSTLIVSRFPEVPVTETLLFCVTCGAVAQSGDLLISLVKRVAHVKDSGHLMPGHGGILDRLDGIFIACPLVYAFALYCRPI